MRQGTALRGSGDRGQWRHFGATAPCSADPTPEPRCSGGAPPCRLQHGGKEGAGGGLGRWGGVGEVEGGLRR